MCDKCMKAAIFWGKQGYSPNKLRKECKGREASQGTYCWQCAASVVITSLGQAVEKPSHSSLISQGCAAGLGVGRRGQVNTCTRGESRHRGR
jgi:hypothetical protein